MRMVVEDEDDEEMDEEVGKGQTVRITIITIRTELRPSFLVTTNWSTLLSFPYDSRASRVSGMEIKAPITMPPVMKDWSGETHIHTHPIVPP